MATTTTSKKQSKKKQRQANAPSACPGGNWSSAAPRGLRESYHQLDSGDGWSTWRKHLAKRKQRPLAKLLGDRHAALRWAVPAGCDLAAAEQLATLTDRTASAPELEAAAQSWLGEAETAGLTAAFGLECLAWAETLSELAATLSESTWWGLCNRLVSVASAEATADDPLAGVLLFAELPLVLAYELPELHDCQRLTDVAARTLDELAADETAARDLARLRPLVASLTRIQLVAAKIDPAVWNAPLQRHFDQMVECALRLSRPDGRQAFDDASAAKWHRRFHKQALSRCQRGKTRRLAQLVAEGAKETRGNAPPPSFEMEDACQAVLRPDWRRRSPQLTVSYGGSIRSELTLGKTCYWSGSHEIEVRLDGQTLEPRDEWSQVCWVSDDDIDYLELEQNLADGVTLQRHMALAREDQFLFLADAVLGTRSGQVEYRATLPLADGVNFVGEAETREGLIQPAKGAALRIVPLALPEWRIGRSNGELSASGDKLELTQSATGKNLLAPLFVDLNPRRLGKELTWRQLTVGRDRTPVERDEAVGYRMQVGRAQWLLYRALGGAAIRTVLGKNLYNELLVARFGAEGKATTLVAIEA